ncbi:MAG TPA: flagellar basal-body rod protein FlgF [Haliangiales bacterium]|nr:flagellar basal-body rod protein FlgF [Haliangiales bacterium]
MANGIYVALSGAVAQSQALDVVSNNVANASTSGYRAVRVTFGEALTKAKGMDQRFAVTQGTVVDATQGTLVQTGNPLDVALQGDGYFGVNAPQGVRWTRAGELRVAADGRLVNADGLEVRGAGGKPIAVPPDAAEITIGADGAVSAGDTQLGKMELARFDPKSMAREGATLYRATAAPVAGAPEVVAGALESSNINVVRGMVDLIRVSRTFEALHRAIETYKEIDQRTAREIGGPK